VTSCLWGEEEEEMVLVLLAMLLVMSYDFRAL
jgi:hypothetical protein